MGVPSIMGYYTSYHLSLDKEEYTHAVFLELEQLELEELFDGGLYGKWYEHEIDMINISKKFPLVLFTLEGHGEEAGDHWIKYFLNGKMQVCTGQIVYPEFDKSKLKIVKL